MSNDKKTIQKRIVDAAVEIRQDEATEIEYQHGVLCQVSLPRKKTEGRIFERSFKNASLRVTAGSLWDGKKWVEQPLPYGPKPRLALIHINSEAVRTQSPQIEIGNSCADFLRRIGLSDQDGRTYNLFKRQMMALAATELSLGFTVGNEATTINARPVKEFKAWINKDDSQPSLWPGELTLSTDYFESLKAHAVPLDPRAVGALSHTSLGLDIYSWLCRRLYALNKSVKVTLDQLKEQFGQEYVGKNAGDDFKKEFLNVLKQVLAVYPDAKLSRVTGGFILNPSRPPVSSTTTKRVRSATQEFLPPPPATSAQTLTEPTVERFRKLYPRLDVYACLAAFDAWLVSGNVQQPANYCKAFLGFAKKWTVGKG